MGALIGLAIQLTVLAIGLMITLTVWAVRLTVMLLLARFSLISSATRRR
jgi:hypothetical protein